MPDSSVTRIELHRSIDGRYVATEQKVRAPRLDAQARADRSSRSVTVIEVDALDGTMQELGDLLRNAAGLSVRESGGIGGSASVSLRGSSALQVPIFLDGVPLSDPQGGGVDLANIPLQSIASIEVYRGSAPLVLGASSLGGAIHLRSHRGRHAQTLTLSRGSYGHLEVNANRSERHGDWIFDLRARALRNDGDWEFLDDRGTLYNSADDRRVRRENNRVEGGGFLLHAMRPSSGWSLRAQLMGDLRQQGAPGYSVRQSLRAESESWTGQGLVAAIAPPSSPWWREVSAFVREENQTFRDPQGDFGGRAADRRDRTRRAGARLLGSWREDARQAFSLSLEQAWLHSEDKLSADLGRGRQTRFSAAAAVEPVLSRGRLSVEPGLRMEFSRDHIDSRLLRSPLDRAAVGALREWSTTARLGIRWQWSPQLSLHSSVGHSERVPTLLERFGDRGTVSGNPELSAERGVQRDAGLVYRPAQGRRFAVSLFDNDAFDLIAYEANSPVSTRPVNVGRAAMRGVEVEAEFGRYGPFDTRLAMTRMSSIDRSQRRYAQGAPLPARPGLELHVVQGVRWGRTRLAVELRAVGENYLQTGRRERVPSRNILDLELRTRWRYVLTGIARIHNLTDVEAFDLWNFPLPGRHVALALRWGGQDAKP